MDVKNVQYNTLRKKKIQNKKNEAASQIYK